MTASQAELELRRNDELVELGIHQIFDNLLDQRENLNPLYERLEQADGDLVISQADIDLIRQTVVLAIGLVCRAETCEILHGRQE